VFDPDVWTGLLNYFPSMGYTNYSPDDLAPVCWMYWPEFMKSRRGYDLDAAYLTSYPDRKIDGLNHNFPTRFVNPLRSYTSANLMPLASMKPTRAIDATILRSETYPGATASNRPLLQFDGQLAVRPDQQQALDVNFNDTDQNAYFRYELYKRLSNVITNRSNVYAIWITLGYFEVERVPQPVDTLAYPDGYRLGAELGTETGETKRHRAFYIFDRSVPMGFQRGKDVNLENGVLVSRYIE
jgi:hypothetical protein